MKFDSRVDDEIDMVETDLRDDTISAGYYRTDGVQVTNVRSEANNVTTVRPLEPFGVSIKTWGK